MDMFYNSIRSSLSLGVGYVVIVTHFALSLLLKYEIFLLFSFYFKS